MQGHYPLLVNDVWEHAYNLKHEYRRPDCLNAWWAVANREEAARRLELSDDSAEWKSEDERGLVVTPTV